MIGERQMKLFVVITTLFLVVACLVVPSSAAAGSTPKSSPKKEQRIEGKWLRPDGGYVLELKLVKPGGTLKADYFNPRPIYVARAGWKHLAERIHIFVELRDVNYPGSTYTLVYDPELDRLTGYYYQAALGRTFDVVFVRLR